MHENEEEISLGERFIFMSESDDPGAPITLEQFEDILRVATDVRHHLPEKPSEGEPLILTEREIKLYKKNGQVTRHWRDGSMTVVMSPERVAEIKKMLGVDK